MNFLILMDIQMPEMNGCKASMAIRALSRDGAKNIPIIVLTVNAFKENVDRVLEHGMNAHVAKPVEIGVFMEILVRFLGTGM